jgi:hypothetical protein
MAMAQKSNKQLAVEFLDAAVHEEKRPDHRTVFLSLAQTHAILGLVDELEQVTAALNSP